MKRTVAAPRPPAVVIGLDCMTVLQTARIMAYRHGVPVIGVAKDRRHPCCRTSVCEVVLFADTGGRELIGVLERLGRRLLTRAVLYPCTDLSVCEVSRARDVLEQWYHLLLPSSEIIETL